MKNIPIAIKYFNKQRTVDLPIVALQKYIQHLLIHEYNNIHAKIEQFEVNALFQ